MLRILMTTVGDSKQADELANKILERKLAACVSIFPIVSKYWWRGSLEEAQEFMLLVKTREELVRDLIDFIKGEHPYEVPEIIVLPVEIAGDDYLRWVEDVTLREAARPDR